MASTCQASQFRDWQRYDSGVFADIFVRTKASSFSQSGGTLSGNTYTFEDGFSQAQLKIVEGNTTTYTTGDRSWNVLSSGSSVTPSGTYSVANNVYTFPGGYESAKMEVNNGGTYTYTSDSKSFTLYTLPQAVTKYTITRASTVTIVNTSGSPKTIKLNPGGTYTGTASGQYYTITGSDDYYLASNVSSKTLTVKPYGSNYHADSTLAYTPETTKTITVSPHAAGTKGGGSVTYVPETVERKVYQPEVYTASSATEATGTFLTQPTT